MSKSKGNAVDPFEALATYGADAIRWYFYINSAPWLPNRFHGKAVLEGQRKFMSTLWNTYAFYVLYAEIDQFDPTKYTLDKEKLTVMDRWLLSKLNTVVKGVDENLADYKLLEAARLLQDFVDELSNWYVRRSRERFWVQDMTDDKITAYMTLYTALVTICKTAAPMIPFMTEEIYQNLVCSVDKNAPESIHLTDYPTVDETMIDKELEDNMEEVLQVVTLGRAARNAANIKNRQPIANIYVKAENVVGELYQNIIKEELNIKDIHFIDDASQFTSYTFKPQLKTLGQRYGKKVNEIRTLLAEIDGSKAKKELDTTGVLKLQLSDGTEAPLAPEDLLIDTAQTEGYMPLEDRGVTVILDTKLTPELIEEGFVREVISKIQSMRKEANFDVMDHIVLYEKDNDKIKDIITRNAEEIKHDTLTDEIVFGEVDGFTADFNVNGEKVSFGVKVNK